MQEYIEKDVNAPGLAAQIARFAGFLKSRGFKVFQSSIHDAIRSLEEVGIFRRGDFYSSLRANLATGDIEWAQFKELFNEFWNETRLESEEKSPKKRPAGHTEEDVIPDFLILQDALVEKPGKLKKVAEKQWLEGIAYSPVASVEKKDLSRFNTGDVQIAGLVLKKMMAPFKIQVSHRSKRSKRSRNMDFSKVLRNSLKTGGLPVKLYYRKKKKRLKRLVILADVSGSMDRYARFVMPFMLGLRGIGSRAEVFVFSTSLTSITFLVRHLSIEKALERISEDVPDWSGGTRIGYSFQQFNEAYGSRLSSRRTVVVIMSDGWDLGGKELLKREMEVLSRKAHSVIWLNPMAGDPDYKPVCQGMRVVLPYVDHFLPADSLQSLRRVGHLLAKVMIN